jgi:hypothetical protein
MKLEIKQKLETYPKNARDMIMIIRDLLFQLSKTDHLGEITESLKWGEPSFTTKYGSPVRVDWKSDSPETVSIFFNCKTRLVETFREVYPQTFIFAGNRELILKLSEPLPEKELKHCLSIALQYHRVKHLTLLGA